MTVDITDQEREFMLKQRMELLERLRAKLSSSPSSTMAD